LLVGFFCGGGARFSPSPSPLRGEGWDKEWFYIALNAANPTSHLASHPERGGIKSKAKPPETARLRCLKTAVKNGAERTVRDLRLEA
jgi:hypothetical protein